MASKPELHRTDEAHRYRVTLDGEHIGDVWRVRFPASFSNRRGLHATNADHYGVGHWGWQADTAPEDEYPTRREAVEDMRAVVDARLAGRARVTP